MTYAFAILIGCQLLGEVLRQALHLSLPGPLIGMALLTLALMARKTAGPATEAATDAGPASPLTQTANTLIREMGLLFVPAGVGVIAEVGVLRQAWLPILAGVFISTILGLVVTGLVMHHVTRRLEARPEAAKIGAAQ